MPTYQMQGLALAAQHNQRIANTGYASDHYFSMVHTPIPIKQAYEIPDAKKAVYGEWEKLFKLGAFMLETVTEEDTLKADALAQGETIHIGD